MNLQPLLDAVKYDANGLVTAIAQDAETGEILMVAYMNEATLRQTVETGTMTYWSRSRQEVWVKGQSSGNTQSRRGGPHRLRRRRAPVQGAPAGRGRLPHRPPLVLLPRLRGRPARRGGRARVRSRRGVREVGGAFGERSAISGQPKALPHEPEADRSPMNGLACRTRGHPGDILSPALPHHCGRLMKAATVKISSRTHQQLKAMAEEDGLTLSDELERVVEAQRRRRFLEGLADDYARIHEDEGAWRAGRQEQASSTPRSETA